MPGTTKQTPSVNGVGNADHRTCDVALMHFISALFFFQAPPGRCPKRRDESVILAWQSSPVNTLEPGQHTRSRRIHRVPVRKTKSVLFLVLSLFSSASTNTVRRYFLLLHQQLPHLPGAIIFISQTSHSLSVASAGWRLCALAPFHSRTRSGGGQGKDRPRPFAFFVLFLSFGCKNRGRLRTQQPVGVSIWHRV